MMVQSRPPLTDCFVMPATLPPRCGYYELSLGTEKVSHGDFYESVGVQFDTTTTAAPEPGKWTLVRSGQCGSHTGLQRQHTAVNASLRSYNLSLRSTQANRRRGDILTVVLVCLTSQSRSRIRPRKGSAWTTTLGSLRTSRTRIRIISLSTATLPYVTHSCLSAAAPTCLSAVHTQSGA